MVNSPNSDLQDADLVTAIIVTRAPQLVETPDVAEFLVRDVLLPEGLAAWQDADTLHNVLGDHLLELDVCTSILQAELLCEDLQKASQSPCAQEVRVCNLLKHGKTVAEAMVSSQIPEVQDWLPPGTCAMCERHMPLTWHHLFPREVQKKFLKRGFMTSEQRSNGISICRQCHSTIHRSFDNELLAEQLHSLESLLQQESIQKWVAYASKQKSRAVAGLRVAR